MSYKACFLLICYTLCCSINVLSHSNSYQGKRTPSQFPSMKKRRREAMAKVKYQGSTDITDETDDYYYNGTFHAPYIDPTRYPICTDTNWVGGK